MSAPKLVMQLRVDLTEEDRADAWAALQLPDEECQAVVDRIIERVADRAVRTGTLVFEPEDPE